MYTCIESPSFFVNFLPSLVQGAGDYMIMLRGSEVHIPTPSSKVRMNDTYSIISAQQVFPNYEPIFILLWPILDDLVYPIIPVSFLWSILGQLTAFMITDL